MESILGDDTVFAKKPQLDVTSRAFQPKKFIKNALSNISHSTFEGTLVDEVGAAEQDTGEALKLLIRDHLGTFIESKDAMSAVFTTDRELFTGEALEDITAAFEEAQGGCEGLVKPIMESYLDVQHSRQSHDILDKLYSVLSVPGTLYDNCGVRVVLSKSAMQIVRNSRQRATTTAAAASKYKKASSQADAGSANGGGEDGVDGEMDEEDEGAQPNADDRDDEDDDPYDDEATEQGVDDGVAAAYAARGALEDLSRGAAGGGPGGLGDFLLEPGEELFFWYGTPLARLRDDDAQRLFEEAASNHEGAVLCLRRAMLYMEENYDLEDGTLLAAEDVEDANEASDYVGKGADNLAAIASASSKKRKVSAVHRSPFTYKFSLALLRAALYLEDQLSEELVRANAADTVLIEDTLSMMMDVSIVTVKLWKFCTVLQTELRRRGNDQALDSLRNKLAEGAENAAAAAAAAAVSASPSFVFPEKGVGGSMASPSFARDGMGDAGGGGGGEGRGGTRRRRYHPAQYFIASTRSMHARLTRASAAALLQEAVEWGKKVAPSPSAEAERRQAREKEDTTSFAYGSGGAGGGGFNASLQFSGGMLGNITDSFVGNSIFLLGGGGGGGGKGPGSASAGAGSPTSRDDELSSMSFAANSNLRVGGFGNDWNAGGHANGGAAGRPAEQHGFAEVEALAGAVLAAFRTPETHYETYTTFSIGSMNMGDILEGSCTQILMHSKAMLQQLSDRSDTEATIMAEGALLNTFTSRLSEACMSNLEHVIVSYWGGIATTIHGGVFDFTPDPATPLGRMLTELTSGNAAVPPSATPKQQSRPGEDSQQSSQAGSFAPSNSSAANAGDNASAAEGGIQSAARLGPGGGGTPLDTVPEIQFIPVLPEGLLRDAEGGDGGISRPATPRANAATTTLRDLSVQAVRRMTRSANDIMYSLFLAFANRAVLSGFVRPMSRYTRGDLLTHSADEQVELHAATLVEVILGQWERIMSQVSEAVLRIKVVIGESCSTATVSSNEQVEEAGELLSELEQLRTSCFRCYTHGIGMLTKAYITLLPMMQHAGNNVSLEHRVRARLSRGFVSSSLPNKLLNLLSVVLDHTVPFLRRFPEVYDSADLFAAKAEDIGPDPATTAASAPARAPRRTLRRRQSSSTTPATTAPASGRHDDGVGVEADPVTQFVASAHAKLVQEHIEEHEELLQALVANLLQSFVDMLHTKSQHVSSGGADAGLLLGDLEEQERGIVECMADTLCLPTTVAPILLEHLLAPCVFELVAQQHSTVPAQVESIVRERKATFEQTYLSRVGEHCQLAVDVMVSMFLAIPQQHIAREVRESGFMAPLFDWQRLSGPAASSVRPYLSNCIVHIARAHETLNWIRQPALGAAVTQRLVAHLAGSFVAAITADINAFEVSLECSPDFLIHGMLLVEAEALTVLDVVNAVMESVIKHTTAGDVLPELVLAKDALNSVAQAIIQQDSIVYETMGRTAAALANDNVQLLPSSGAGGGGGGGAAVPASAALPTPKERKEKRDAMVATATANLRYMVAAICTHLEDNALVPTTSLLRQGGSSTVTETIAERLARRKEGYEVRHATKPRRRSPSSSKQKKRDGTAPTAPEEGAGGGSPRKSKLLSRHRAADDANSGVPPLPLTPRAYEGGDDAGPLPVVAADIAATLYQNPAPQQANAEDGGEAAAAPRRTVRRRRAPKAEATAAVPTSAAAAPPSTPAQRQQQQVAQPQAPPLQQQPVEEQLPVPRRSRRRVVSSAAPSVGGGASEDGGGGRRERRTNRFKRSAAV